MVLPLSTFERLDGLYSQLVRMGDFMDCADPREFIRVSNRLLDACIDAGMPYDQDNHETWAAALITRCLSSATMVEAA